MTFGCFSSPHQDDGRAVARYTWAMRGWIGEMILTLASDSKRRVIVPGEAPFGPITILVATLLASILAGVYLVAVNWERLYRPDLGRRQLCL